MRNLLVTVALVAGVQTAHADKTRVFPLSAPDAEVAMKLTKALASSIKAEVANVPIEDAAGLLECDPESSSCLTAVAKSVTADRLVFGVITVQSRTKLKVTLTKFDPAGPDRQQRTFEISGSSADALAAELVRVSGPLFGKPEGKPSKPIAPDKPDPDKQDPDKQDPDKQDPDLKPKTASKISSTTWAIAGGGAVAVLAGVGVLVSAQSIKDAANAAPHDTIEDFQRLRILEDRGVLRTRIGDALLVVGGVAMAIGVVRAIMERRKSTEATIVQPVPIEGGVAIMLTVIR